MRSEHIAVAVPGGHFEARRSGLSYVPDDTGDTAWVLSLTEAERVFDAALRSVRAILEVAGGRGNGVWVTPATTDPGRTPPASLPYCPFCQAPTCKCWEEHDCR